MDPLLGKISDFYSQAINEHGAVPQGVNWNGMEKQVLRFQYLAELVRDETAPLSLADLGCGYGALYQYFKQRGTPVSDYVGYDVSPAMIETAGEVIGGNPEVSLRLGSRIEEPVDWAFASGIFNVTLGQDSAAWEKLVLATLDNMHQNTRKGFAFNIMTDKVDWKDDNLFYANAGDFFNYCTNNLSRRVRLIHDTPLFEWTMLVYK